jgi:hypothetical protein
MSQAEQLLMRSRALKNDILNLLRDKKSPEILMALSHVCFELGTISFKDDRQADEYAEKFELLGSRLITQLTEVDEENVICDTDLDVLLVLSGMLTELAATDMV